MPGEFGIIPGAADVIGDALDLLQLFRKCLLRQQYHQAGRGPPRNGAGYGQSGIQPGRNRQDLVVGFIDQIDTAGNEYGGRRSENFQVVGIHLPGIKLEVAHDGVEGHALLIDILEIQLQAPVQGIEVDQPQHPRQAGFEIQEAARRHVQLGLTLHLWDVGLEGRPRPVEVETEIGFAAGKKIHFQGFSQQFSHVVRGDNAFHPGRAAAAVFPAAVNGNVGQLAVGIQFFDDLVCSILAGYEFQLAQVRLVQAQLPAGKPYGGKIGRQQFFRRGSLAVRLVFVTGLQVQLFQFQDEGAIRAVLGKFDVAGDIVGFHRSFPQPVALSEIQHESRCFEDIGIQSVGFHADVTRLYRGQAVLMAVIAEVLYPAFHRQGGDFHE